MHKVMHSFYNLFAYIVLVTFFGLISRCSILGDSIRASMQLPGHTGLQSLFDFVMLGDISVVMII